MNKLVIHLYQFIRFYVLQQHHQSLPLPTIDKTFIKNSLSILNFGIKSGTNIDLNNIYQLYKLETNHVPPKIKNATCLFGYIAVDVLKNYSNNIIQNFIKYLHQFLQITLHDEDINEFKYDILFLRWEQEKELFSNWLKNYSDILFPPPHQIKKNICYDLRVKPFIYLNAMIYMNGIFENLKRQEEYKNIKLYQPLPLRSNLVPKSILFDTAAIISLFPLPMKQTITRKSIFFYFYYFFFNFYFN